MPQEKAIQKPSALLDYAMCPNEGAGRTPGCSVWRGHSWLPRRDSSRRSDLVLPPSTQDWDMLSLTDDPP
jgi:hypothetical protein